MTAATVPLQGRFKDDGVGPYVEWEVNDPDDLPSLDIHHMASLSSGKAIPAAADAINVGVIVDRFERDGVYYVRVHIGGGVLQVVFSSATAAGTPIKIADNQTVLANAGSYDPTKDAGMVTKVISTNVAEIRLRPFGIAAYAS